MPWSEEWFRESKKWVGRILDGQYAHWCDDWDGLPVDETTKEFECCTCFKCSCGALMVPKAYPFGRHSMELLDDIWECPKARWWKPWEKHRWYNRGPNYE